VNVYLGVAGVLNFFKPNNIFLQESNRAAYCVHWYQQAYATKTTVLAAIANFTKTSMESKPFASVTNP
jgi:hypothetical protein